MKRKNWGLLIGSAILSLLVLICFVYSPRLPKAVRLNYKQVVDVYDTLTLNDLITDANATILNGQEKLSTNTLGAKKQTVKLKYQHKIYQTTLTYEVVDQIKPQIFGGSVKKIALNDDLNLCDLVIYADNYDRYPECQIKGDYDLTQVGNYDISIVIADHYGNKNNHHLNLKVYDPKQEPDSSNDIKMPEPLLFREAIKKYQQDNYEFGIDVSKWQEKVDFNKVREEGATFVMLRIGHKTQIGSEITLDPYFQENLKNAQAAGLKVGVYLYSKASNIKEAKTEAKWVIKTLNKAKLDLPIAFDWENWSSWNSYHLTFHDLNEIAKTFIKTVEDAGYTGIIYGSKFYLENFFTEQYDHIWLAHYTDKTSYENFAIWQFSNIGKIDGIKGNVDLDLKVKE